MGFTRFMKVHLAVAIAALCGATEALAVLVPLDPNATATFSQAGFSVDEAVDGVVSSGNNGWAIDPNEVAQTAVFEPLTPVAGQNTFVFTLTQAFLGVPPTNGGHLLGKFRLSVTTDPSASFGNGADTAGNVAATWIQLAPSTATAVASTLTINNDNTVLASMVPAPQTDVYTITANSNVLGSITGFRLEVIEDPSLPGNGPGRKFNGNFVLTEFAVAAVPEVSSAMLFAAVGCVVGGGALIRRRRVA